MVLTARQHGYQVKDDHRITLLAVSITDCVINVWLETANKVPVELETTPRACQH